jgi:hypothetical protein
MKFKKYAALGLAIVAPMSLSGCLLLPGEFNSEMTILKSGVEQRTGRRRDRYRI